MSVNSSLNDLPVVARRLSRDLAVSPLTSNLGASSAAGATAGNEMSRPFTSGRFARTIDRTISRLAAARPISPSVCQLSPNQLIASDATLGGETAPEGIA